MGNLPSVTQQSLDLNSSVPKATPFPSCQTSSHFRFADLKVKGGKERGFRLRILHERAGGKEAACQHLPPHRTVSEVCEDTDNERRLVTAERAPGCLLG